MERTREEKMAIAETILAQLGGQKFKVMTGAKEIFAVENGLSLRLPASGEWRRRGINYIRITLEPTDTYKMEFKRIRGHKVTDIAEHSMIYDHMLQSIFTAETGLDTHL